MASVPFQTDYARPSSLTSAKLGASQRARQTAAVTASGSVAANLDAIDADSLTGDEYLDKLEERVNKSIDDDLASLVDGFQQLVMLSSIKDKDKVLIAQDAFQSDLKADAMVRSAQSLSLLSSSVSLSLLLAKSPDPSLDDEAKRLIEETEEEKKRCRELINLLGGIEQYQFADGQEQEQEEEDEDQGQEDPNQVEKDPKDTGKIADDALRISQEKEKNNSSKVASNQEAVTEEAGLAASGGDEDEDEEMEDVQM